MIQEVFFKAHHSDAPVSRFTNLVAINWPIQMMHCSRVFRDEAWLDSHQIIIIVAGTEVRRIMRLLLSKAIRWANPGIYNIDSRLLEAGDSTTGDCPFSDHMTGGSNQTALLSLHRVFAIICEG